MKICINNISKCEKFVAIFQQLKYLTGVLCWKINGDKISINGLDQSHVLMFQLVLGKTWFDDFESDIVESEIDDAESNTIYICSNLFAKILNTRFEHQTIKINFDTNSDNINIVLESDDKAEFNKSFILSLMDAAHEALVIPDMEYTAEFSIESKKLNCLVDQLSLVDDIVNIHCDEKIIKFTTDGIEGKMEVSIPHNDIEEYIIDEEATLDIRYSLGYMKKFCQYHKVCDSVEIQLSDEYPLMVTYKLNALNYLKFYLAPKIDDN